MREEEAFIAVVLLLSLSAYIGRKHLSSGTRAVLSAVALAADLRDYLSE